MNGPSGPDELYGALLEAVSDAVLVVDGATGRYVLANTAAERLLGYSREELFRLNADDVSAEEPTDLQAASDAIGRDGSWRGEWRLRRKDGSVVLTEATTGRVVVGDRVLSQGVFRDVTRIREAEAAQHEAEDRYRQLVEQLPAVVYVAKADSVGTAVYVSPRIATLLGFTPEEWIAESDLWSRQLHPDDRERVFAQLERAHAAGEPYQCEYRLLTRSGDVIWVRDKATIQTGEDGQPASIQGFLLDITERKQAEDALRESEARFRAVFERAGIGIAVVDRHGRPIMANPTLERMLGFDPAELPTISFKELTHPDDIEAEQALYHDVLNGIREGYDFQKRYVRKDGSIVHGQLVATVIRQQTGEIQYLLGMVQDMTERVRHEQRQSALLRVAHRLAAETEPTELMRSVIEETIALVGGNHGIIGLWNDDTGTIVPAWDTLPINRPVPGLPLGHGAGGLAAERHAVVIMNDYPEQAAGISSETRGRFRAAIAAPLLHEGRLLGALSIMTDESSHRFTPDDAAILELLASLASASLVGLDRRRLAGALLAARTAQHELNNQLALTVGYAELLASDSELPPRLRQLAAEAVAGAQAASETVDRLQRITQLKELNVAGPFGSVIDLSGSTA